MADETASFTFGEFLKSRAVLFGIVDEQGRASAALLSERFLLRGIQATPRAVESWFANERAPRIGRMELILDELGVHGADRLLAYRLASGIERDEPAAAAVGPVAGEDSSAA